MSIKVEQALISPRYLAGPGDPAWVTAALHGGAGWSHGHDPLMPRVVLTSPDQKTLLRLEPDLNEPWWHLAHRDGRTGSIWNASFGGGTPVELIAAVTDALTDPEYNARQVTDPCQPLRRAGWDAIANGQFRSPDSRVKGERFNFSGSISWRITATLDPDDPLWHAWFSGGMPPVLVAAFIQALADPEPVRRSHEQTIGFPRRHITLRWQEWTAESVARALPERIEHLAARRTSTPPPAPPTPPSAHRRTR
ncbi:hypothetical protein BJP40_03745 [Streptomyces sp. CC53]|uniref:DUF317 domain-containing protein n=1 Tax=Streptomyces sp. CC53 TaxID=1906740 RepID=UPI0008DD9C94|nr:DUF317 domain-containing protein [Streptomyces sp. CC53]OII62129.1 hypothetical protein BJP40_03745 [Streptomyces sp. CC53]